MSYCSQPEHDKKKPVVPTSASSEPMSEDPIDLGRFQLAEPYHYVVELVRAALGTGATSVDIDMDADDMVLSFDGEGFAHHELEALTTLGEPDGLELLWHCLSAPDFSARRLGHLARGVINALRLDPKILLLESGNGVNGIRMRFTSPAGAEIELADGIQGTRVHLRERLSLKVIAEALFVANPEEKVLAEYCCYSSMPIRLNGRELRAGALDAAVEKKPALRRRFEFGGLRGEMALPLHLGRRGEHPARIVLCAGGMKMEAMESAPGDEWHGTGLVAFVDSSTFGLDPQRNRVLRDQAHQEAIDLLTLEYRALMLELVAAMFGPDEKQPSMESEDRLGALRHAARLFLRAEEAGELPPEVEKLLDVEGIVKMALSWPHHSPLRPFWNAVLQGGLARIASRSYPVSDLDVTQYRPDWKSNLVALGPFDMLQAVFGMRMAFADDDLVEIARKKTGFDYPTVTTSGTLEPKLAGDQAMVSIAIHADNIAGQAGLFSVIPEKRGARVTLLREGRFIGQEIIADAPFSGHAVFEAGSTLFVLEDPTSAYQREKALGLASRAINDRKLEILHALHQSFPTPPPPEELTGAGCWLDGKVQDMDNTDIGLDWNTDPRSRVARWHLDEACPLWLRFWPIFHRLDGTPVHLAWLMIDPGSFVRFVVREPWGNDTPDLEVLNLSEGQRDFLGTVVKSRMTDFTTRLRMRRGR
jgi:hypothetical protein